MSIHDHVAVSCPARSAGGREPGRRAASAVALAAIMLALGAVGGVRAQQSGAANPLNPDSPGHFQVRDPADLGPDRTEAIYRRLFKEMTGSYALSGDRWARTYGKWRRYNTAPYRSDQHGARFVNNYANAAGAAYGRYERSGPMPAGAVLAKDSFSVDARGTVRSGPLFLMEKMAPGFNADSGDWRYSMILPDGSLLGATRGENAENVAFCVPCHLLGGKVDHMFYVPEAVRLRR